MGSKMCIRYNVATVIFFFFKQKTAYEISACLVGSEFYRLYPYQLFIPGVFISVTILAFYLFGNCLRDALDPHLRD